MSNAQTVSKSWRWRWADGVWRRAWQWLAPANEPALATIAWTMDDVELEFCPRTGRYLELGQGDA